MAKALFVKDIKSPMPIETQLAVYSVEVRTARNGKEYVNFSLGDLSGTIIANHWTNKDITAEEICDKIKEGCIASVKASASEYNEKINLKTKHEI